VFGLGKGRNARTPLGLTSGHPPSDPLRRPGCEGAARPRAWSCSVRLGGTMLAGRPAHPGGYAPLTQIPGRPKLLARTGRVVGETSGGVGYDGGRQPGGAGSATTTSTRPFAELYRSVAARPPCLDARAPRAFLQRHAHVEDHWPLRQGPATGGRVRNGSKIFLPAGHDRPAPPGCSAAG